MKKFLNVLKVKSTYSFVKDSLLSDPNYPSILSITNTLDRYKIESVTLQVDAYKLKEVPLPAIVQVQSKDTSLFYVLTHFKKNRITFYDDTKKKKQLPTKDFLKIWTGVCLVAEASEKSKEPEINQKLFVLRLTMILGFLMVFCLLVWVQTSVVSSPMGSKVLLSGFVLLKIIGLFITSQLLWLEIDRHNPMLQKFCSGTGENNCNTILGSKYANIFKGTISLGSIGFAYFFSTLFYVLVAAFSNGSFGFISILALMTAPVILISIFYQAYIIKKWCRLCIAVQSILVGELCILLVGKLYSYGITWSSLSLWSALFIAPILGWLLLKPVFQNQEKAISYRRSLKKIKKTPEVFNLLLQKARKIEKPSKELGISLPVQPAQYTITKVSDPYCAPCAKAHHILEELYQQGKINLQLVFKPKTGDKKSSRLIHHFMAIDQKYDDDQLMQKALNDWYLSYEKDYDSIQKKYPVNGALVVQDKKLDSMSMWCEKMEIQHTPTIFINGYELPKGYSVQDLPDVL